MSDNINSVDYCELAKELAAMDNWHYDRKPDIFSAEKLHIIFLKSCIPLFLSLLFVWKDSIYYTIGLFVLYFISWRMNRKEEETYGSCMLKAIPLIIMFAVERFTLFQIFSSQKIFVFIYAFSGFLLYSAKWAKKTNEKIMMKNKPINHNNNRANSIIEIFNSTKKSDDLYYWWDSSILYDSEPYNGYIDEMTDEETETVRNKVRYKREVQYSIEFENVSKDDYPNVMYKLIKGSRIIFGSSNSIVDIQPTEKVKRILLKKETKTDWTTTTWKNPDAKEIEEFSKDYNERKDKQEKRLNPMHLTDKEMLDMSIFLNADAKTINHNLVESMFSDFDRSRAVENFSKTRVYNEGKTRTKVYEHYESIGYIVGDNLILLNLDNEKNRIVVMLDRFICYKYACLDVARAYFKKNITKGYATQKEADIASYIAHNRSFSGYHSQNKKKKKTEKIV